MAVTDKLKSAGNELVSKVGLVEKAVIKIYDRREETVELIRKEARSAAKSQALAAEKKAFELRGKNLSLGDAVQVYKNAFDATLGFELSKLSDSYAKTFVVPFNPSSLRIRARGRSIINVQGQGAGDSGHPVPDPKVTVTVSVRLIFDEVTARGSFMADRTNLSVSNVAQTAGSVISTAATEKADPDVQKYVEGFVAAMSSRKTREVAFQWGELYYFGRLNQISAQYVMFNTLGQPVRAYVDLSIHDIDEKDATQTLGVRWDRAYRDAFGDGKMSMMREGQKASNLFNIG